MQSLYMHDFVIGYATQRNICLENALYLLIKNKAYFLSFNAV